MRKQEFNSKLISLLPLDEVPFTSTPSPPAPLAIRKAPSGRRRKSRRQSHKFFKHLLRLRAPILLDLESLAAGFLQEKFEPARANAEDVGIDLAGRLVRHGEGREEEFDQRPVHQHRLLAAASQHDLKPERSSHALLCGRLPRR